MLAINVAINLAISTSLRGNESRYSRVLARICNLGVQSVNLAWCMFTAIRTPANKDQNILNIVSTGNAFFTIPGNKCPNSEIARIVFRRFQAMSGVSLFGRPVYEC